MKKFKSIFFYFLPIAVVIICIFVTIYAVAAQLYRAGLNDPQTEMATRAALSLDEDVPLEELITVEDPIDITYDLRPFIAVYDELGDPVASTGSYRDALPKPPHGVFASAKEMGENRVTWEPSLDTRIALVVKPLKDGGFVASGRNMKEVEERVEQLFKMVLVGMVGTLVLSLVSVYLGDRWRRGEIEKHHEKN